MAGRQAMPTRTERRTVLDAPPAQVWAALEHVDRYQRWWAWLRAFDGHRLVAGDRWRCTVQPPVPYRVSFTIELVEAVSESCVTALVTGDVEGRARIDLEPHEAGTTLLFLAELRAGRPWLARIERWARPVARFGHDRIVDRALAEFAANLSGAGV